MARAAQSEIRGPLRSLPTAGIEIRGLPPFAKTREGWGTQGFVARSAEVKRCPFIPRGPATPVHDCKESRMKFFCFSMLHRKSGGSPTIWLRTPFGGDQHWERREGCAWKKPPRVASTGDIFRRGKMYRLCQRTQRRECMLLIGSLALAFEGGNGEKVLGRDNF